MNNITNSKAYKVLMATLVGLMLVAIIIMSVFLGLYASDTKGMRSDIENIYQQAYYTLLESNVRLENSLAKLPVISSPRLIETTLEDITRDCEVATCAINTMSSGDNALRGMLQYYNQLGDYHSYLLRLVKRSGKLAKNDYDTVASFATRSRSIGAKLSAMRDKLANGYLFTEGLAQDSDPWTDIITELDKESSSYPALIYDGPFSDGVKDRVAKNIGGDTLSPEQSLAKAKYYLQDYNILSIAINTANFSRITSIVIDAELEGERHATLEIAHQGGSLLMMDIYKDITEPLRTPEECKLLAEQYCAKIGLPNMRAVWINNNNSVAYINLCYEQDGVILYPDMVKIKVAMDTGEIIGFEGLNFAYNHCDRALAKPTLTLEDAIISVNTGFSDIQSRLTLIPITVETEILCYEISGKIGEETYFVYVDVLTHEEIKILRVIDSNQGDLLM